MNKKSGLIFVLAFAAASFACSSRQMYEAFQENQRTNCLSVSPEKYGECMKKANIDYDTYRMQRAAITE